MMGRTHALTGAAGGIAGAVLADVPLTAGIAGAVVCTGAAILPDIDHPRSTVSNVYGPVTRGFCVIMRILTGGHRRGTHSLPGIFALGLVAQAGLNYRHTWYGATALSVILILCLAGGIRLLKIPGWLDDFMPVPVVVGVVGFTDVDLTWVPVAVMLGCLIHVVGDMMTMTGCPLFWPLSRETSKFKLFKTNGWTERWVVTPLVIVVILAELAWMFYRGVDTVL